MRRLGVAIVLAAAFAIGAAGSASAFESGVAVTVNTWEAGAGRAYVGVKAEGRWARPGTRSCIAYYSTWDHRAPILTDPVRDQWAVKVLTCSGSTVNPLNPTMVITSRVTPGIGVRPSTSGVLSLDLGVAVDPVTAPADTTRTVTAALGSGWLGAVGDHIRATIVPGSVSIRRWTVDFGDGTVRTIAPSAATPNRLSATHAYGPGEFTVRVTARVVGRAYAAFFVPDGTPFESTVPWAVDITNAAPGVSGLPTEYAPPMVTVAASPSGTLPDGTTAGADATGHTALWWPRGLPCDLFVRAIVEREGFMRSGGVVIGQGRTRLVSYRYARGTNDARGSRSWRSGRPRAATPPPTQRPRPRARSRRSWAPWWWRSLPHGCPSSQPRRSPRLAPSAWSQRQESRRRPHPRGGSKPGGSPSPVRRRRGADRAAE
jgi:hypothetical protein